MFRFLRQNRKTPRVYAGSVIVVPRVDNGGLWDFFTGGSNQGVEARLQQQLKELFALTACADRADFKEDDLGLDVFLSSYQQGGFESGTVGSWEMDFFWRPTVELKARLYSLNTGKEKSSFRVVERVTWKELFGRVLVRRWFTWRWETFDEKDLEALLNRAGERLLKKMIAKV